jgi:acetyl-CoA acetyltransferase
MNKRVVIVSAVRTPLEVSWEDYQQSPRLGAIAIKGALDKINLDPNLVDEVLWVTLFKQVQDKLLQDKQQYMLVYQILLLAYCK